MKIELLPRQGDWAATRYFSWKSDLCGGLVSWAAKNAQNREGASDFDSFLYGLESRLPNVRPDIHDEEVDRLWADLYGKLTQRRLTVEVDPKESVANLIKYVERATEQTPRFYLGGKPSISVVDLVDRRPLSPEGSLEEHGIKDGDTLGVLIEYPALGDYCLGPAPNPAKMFEVIRSADATPPSKRLDAWLTGDESSKSAADKVRLWGALLYTDEDIEIAEYVRKYFLPLNILSGEHLYIFVIEKPADWEEAKQYWSRVLDKNLLVVWSAMQWLNSAPYSKSYAYEIARTLGVPEDQLPCLVLFDKVETPEKLVFPIAEASPAYFRKLFSLLRDAMSSLSPSETSDENSSLFAITSVYEHILRSLKAVKTTSSSGLTQYNLFADRIAFLNNSLGPAMEEQQTNREVVVSESFNFHGEGTVFINRPTDTIIQDFQNNYIGGETGTSKQVLEELKRLIELVMESKNLTSEDKETTLQALHSVATQVKDKRANKLTLKGTLEAIQGVVEKAADVAGPAVAIVASVLKLLGLA